MDMSYFDCASSPLTKGVNLIEASAGTGKTYAIAMVVLRAIAELEVPVEKILVVTFTKAATEELKGRIRGRLLQARDLLEGAAGTDDPTMSEWLQNLGDRQSVFKRIQLALYDIDQAGIYTIHSFCQRMLQEQALESGQLFDVELLADVSSIRTQVVEDFWRRNIYGLSPKIYSVLLRRGWTTPEKLYESVKDAGGDYDRLEPQTGSLQEAVNKLEQTFTGMASWWQGSGETENLRALFFTCSEEGKFKKEFNEQVYNWWQNLEDYFTGMSLQLPEKTDCLTRDGLLGVISGAKIRGEEKQRQFIADWPLPDTEAREFSLALENLAISFRAHLVQELSVELSRRLYSQGRMSYDDLISRLDRGLRENGEALRRIIGQRYDVALIDEFQDTDGAQWRIFSALFGQGSHCMYLIGDPKQAIYKFRGADIYSYFAARTSARKRLTLQRNFRSHPELVQEVNRLFRFRSNPFGYEDEKLLFNPVEAARTGDDGELYQSGIKQPVMTYWQLAPNSKKNNGSWSSAQASELFCQQTVAEILKLLNPENPVEYRVTADGAGGSRSLRPQDIAILVRSHNHAQLYQAALAELGVAAIISSKKSVFATIEARELYRLLQAITTPGNGLLVKSAMTISWFGMTGNELQQVWEDEKRGEEWFTRFHNYSEMWREKGFLAMLSQCLEGESVYVTLAGMPLAERRIANIQHLVELVQEAELEDNLGPDQTLLWLKSRLDGEAGLEDVEMRLESDEEAVRIVTMHSAKGLQYPVVFCPYLWYRSNRLNSEKDLVRSHDESGQLVVDIGSAQFEERKRSGLQEELAEELRLLYVAVTRAELKCYIMWAETAGNRYVSDSFQSALGYILFDTKKKDLDTQYEVLRRIASGESAAYERVTGIETIPYEYRRLSAGDEQLSARLASDRGMHTDYQMSSYSAMASLSENEDHGTESGAAVDTKKDGGQILHTGLPAGASFGNLIHDSLELIPFHLLAKGEDKEGCIEKLCSRYGIDIDSSTVMDLLATVVRTPLASSGQGEPFSLSDIGEDRCMKEMPFYFRLNHIETEQINRALAGESTVVPLSNKGMQGYLTGFVDLICEHGGRYYILDYKTNYLGENLYDYSGDKLTRAMASHNYGLQYWIYTVILNRYLQNVKENYDYRVHFGGVMYLFVRGMVPDTPGSGVYFALPDVNILQRLDTLLGGTG